MSARSEPLRLVLGVVALCALDRGAAALLRALAVRFPSSVAGMLLCFTAMATLRALVPAVAERVALWLTPARRFLARWMALFFVPPLVLLPLTPVPGASELARIALILSGGLIATLLATATLARALSRSLQTPASVTDTVPRAASRARVLASWCALGAFGLSLWMLEHAEPGRTLFGVALAVVAFVLGESLREWLTRFGLRRAAAFCHPVLVSALGTGIAWQCAGFPLSNYLKDAARGSNPGTLLMMMLAPAVVTLGLSLDLQRRLLRAGAFPLLLTTACSALFSLFGSAFAARALQLSELYGRALVPRSVTTPVALAIAQELGADAGLTAVFVILSGVFGALVAKPLLERAGMSTPFVLGIATGACSHGIGTAALARDDAAAAALSGISFALTAAISVSLVSLAPIRAALLAIVG